MKYAVIFGAIGLLAGCAHHAVVQPQAKMTRIHRIAIQTFEGEGGAAVTQAFVQALKGGGLAVVAAPRDADAVITGVVTDYQARRKATIFLGPTLVQATGHPDARSSNPIFSLHSAQNLAQISAMNPGNPSIVAETAVVGAIIRLQEAPKGKLLWGDEFVYEGLELPSVLQTVTAVLARSLQQAAPSLQRTSEPSKKG